MGFPLKWFINYIKIDSPKLRGTCPVKENLLLLGCGDNSIKLNEIEKGLIIF